MPWNEWMNKKNTHWRKYTTNSRTSRIKKVKSILEILVDLLALVFMWESIGCLAHTHSHTHSHPSTISYTLEHGDHCLSVAFTMRDLYMLTAIQFTFINNNDEHILFRLFVFFRFSLSLSLSLFIYLLNEALCALFLSLKYTKFEVVHICNYTGV